MTYSSESALMAAMKAAAVRACDNMAGLVKDDLQKAVSKYYDSYHPDIYARTYALYHTPNTKRATSSGNGAIASVYLDTSHVYEKNPMGLDGYRHYAIPWTMTQVIQSADNGLHGGHLLGQGVSVWKQPIALAKAKENAYWRKALSSAGFTVI